MKYLMIFSLLLLAGCSSGYSVGSSTRTSCPAAEVSEATYYCKRTRPIFFYDTIVKVCKNLDECNNYCAERNSKDE